MYNGKRSGKRAGKNSALILALILFLTLNIGGTIAFLYRQADSVTNTFIPGKVQISIDETVTGNVKSKVVIKNDNSNVPVYIRVALVGNWATAEGEICVNHTDNPLSSLTLGEKWKLGDDGFYYYTESVAVGGSTTDLLDTGIELSSADDGCSYQLEVIASAIQAEGDDETNKAVMDAWGLDPSTLGQSGS